MPRRCPHSLLVAATLILGGCSMSQRAPAESPPAPLRVLKSNPRYFTDGSGKAILLTGSHTWPSLQDMGDADPSKAFDFNAYLHFLQKNHHNFVRLWRWELPQWVDKSKQRRFSTPQPWLRAGPGLATDGKPKFDLTRFDPDYFARLKDRVAAAHDKGIYVSVMLFEGYGMQFELDPWKDHPFYPDNNINHLKDSARDAKPVSIFELANPAITAVQEEYVRHVIDTVNAYDNVLFEISNENHGESTKWQYHMIRFIKDYESKKPLQHPVGMTFQYKGGVNANLFQSPADWISPNSDGGYKDNPPASDGTKVILTDTDHLWGEGGDHQWVWKSVLRGLNPIYMDRIVAVTHDAKGEIPHAQECRDAMGAARQLADRIVLANMTPHNTLASTQYCLANPGKEYLVYLPQGGKITLDLSDAKGSFLVEWIDPIKGAAAPADPVSGGEKRSFTAPGEKDAVLHLTLKL